MPIPEPIPAPVTYRHTDGRWLTLVTTDKSMAVSRAATPEEIKAAEAAERHATPAKPAGKGKGAAHRDRDV